jgi:hypothetical protein
MLHSVPIDSYVIPIIQAFPADVHGNLCKKHKNVWDNCGYRVVFSPFLDYTRRKSVWRYSDDHPMHH